jgi:putative ABC transport system permease protein
MVKLLYRLVSSIIVGMKMAFIEMSTHKLRSMLSILGVLLGVASLVAMLTLIGGIDVYLNERMGKWIGTVWFWRDWDPEPEEKVSWSRSPGMRLSDAAYLEERSPDVKDALLSIGRWGQSSVAGKREDVMCQGMEPSVLDLQREQVYIQYGRWPGEDEFERGARVCAISWQIVESVAAHYKITDTTTLIGKTVVFRSVPFTIIGIFAPIKPNDMPWHLRRAMIVPIATMQRYIVGIDPDPGRLEIQVTDPQNVKIQAKKVAAVLAGRHRGVEDFEYRTAEWLDSVKTMLNNVSLLMAVVSIMSLLVGGLSIMNVMLSSISERIREIGTRKALGALDLQIFVQFIAETTTLSMVGGAMGLSLGTIPLFFKDAILQSTQGAIEPTLLPLHVFYTFLIISGVGILFGLYPAVKASRMNPVDALRYE